MDGAVPSPSPVTLQRLAERAATVRALADDIPSPCINVCRMDPEQAVCQGCFRTLDEIAAWSRSDDDTKRLVWARIAERLSPSRPAM